jgi:mRNA interferase MazF
VVTRTEIYWADLGPPAGRRPVCVVTRDAAIEVLHSVTCVPITRTVRGIASEVEVGPESGLPEAGVITCDNLLTVARERLDREPVGMLALDKRIELDRALRFALGITY